MRSMKNVLDPLGIMNRGRCSTPRQRPEPRPPERVKRGHAPCTRTVFPSNATANACTGLAPAATSSAA